MKKVETLDLEKLDILMGEGESFYIYFSAPNCGVCEALKPKLQEFMSEKFPLLQPFYSNTGQDASLAAQLGLYTNPSILVFVGGQEISRRSRVISLNELEATIGRYYQMYFE